MRKLHNLRWRLVSILFLASVLNYLDRQTLSILAPSIQADLHISDTAYAGIVNLFLAAYTVAYLFSGRLTDKLGTRASMALFVGWWSVANMLTGLARSAASLGACRFLLGLGEAGNYTVGPKVVSEWFPARERGVAIGIYTLGATIGATIAPGIVIALAGLSSWRTAFVVTGALGLLWLIPWLLLYAPPERHPRITDAERQMLADSRREDAAGAPVLPAEGADISEANPWRAVFSRRDVWALMAARMLTDPVWYFYQFWLAKYLTADRGVGQQGLGITWVVFLAADVGTLAGGLLSGRLIRRGRAPSAARMVVMGACACLLPLSPLVAAAPSVATCLAVAMLMVVSHLTWLINLSALVVDRVPQRIVATAFGVIAAGSTLGGICMNSFVGWLVTHHTYTVWFVIAAFLHPAAWLLLRAAGLHRPPAPVR
jgi:ACS family hexuronate transporter-like MFS transporter